MLAVIVTIANATYKLPDSARSKIELRRRLIDNYCGQLQNCHIRVNKAQLLIPPIDFGEHLTLRLSHARQAAARLHG